MRAEIEQQVADIKQSLELLRGGDFDYDKSVRKLDELNALSEDPNLWDLRRAHLVELRTDLS